MKCEYCDIVDRKTQVLYEDKDVVVAIKDKVAVPGQITVFSKEHLPIIETVPDHILKKCSVVANKMSSAVFETFGCQGTNIIIQNGTDAGQNVPHFGMEIIPRNPEDGLNLSWPPKQLTDDEMQMTLEKYQEELKRLEKEAKEPKKQEAPQEESDEPQSGKKKKKQEKNYLLKNLRRMP